MNNYPSYSYGDTFRRARRGYHGRTCRRRAKYGNTGLRLSEATQVTNALGTLLVVINLDSSTPQFGRDGQPAAPAARHSQLRHGRDEFSDVQDTFKMRRDLTLTYGVRYGLSKFRTKRTVCRSTLFSL